MHLVELLGRRRLLVMFFLPLLDTFPPCSNTPLFLVLPKGKLSLLLTVTLLLTPSRDGLANVFDRAQPPRQLQRRRFLFSARGRRRRRCAKGARARATDGLSRPPPPQSRSACACASAAARLAAASCCFSEGPSKKWKDDGGVGRRSESDSRM